MNMKLIIFTPESYQLTAMFWTDTEKFILLKLNQIVQE